MVAKKPSGKRDLTGQRFGRWYVVGKAWHGQGAVKGTRWTCRCDCGTERYVLQSNLLNGMSASCGCVTTEKINEFNRTHGETHSAEYATWCRMHTRCSNEKIRDYPNYGGRGIRVCERWSGVDGFIRFLEDMGRRPSALHSIDRIDNDGNYEPGNCRWAKQVMQVMNRRTSSLYTHAGETKTIGAWAKHFGLPQTTLRYRLLIKKMSFLEAVGKPVERRNLAKIEYGGRMVSLSELAKITGVPYDVLHGRLNNGMPLEEAIKSAPLRVRRHTLAYAGVTKSLVEWAKLTGIGEDALRSRIIKSKWTAERALTTPPEGRENEFHHPDECIAITTTPK